MRRQCTRVAATVILWVLAVLFAAALVLVLAYGLAGSQEMFPTPEREEAVRIVAVALAVPLLLAEALVLATLWWLRRRRR